MSTCYCREHKMISTPHLHDDCSRPHPNTYLKIVIRCTIYMRHTTKLCLTCFLSQRRNRPYMLEIKKVLRQNNYMWVTDGLRIHRASARLIFMGQIFWTCPFKFESIRTSPRFPVIFNTFTAIVDLSRFNNSCLKSPASTLVDLTFQSRTLRSFSLNQLRNLSL